MDARGGETARVRRAVWRDVALVWGLSRACWFVAGALGHAFLASADFVGAYRPPHGALSYWAHWDGAWYLHIAGHGYDSVSTTEFFPAYPLATRGVTAAGVSPAVAGLLVSNAAAFVALFFVYRLAEHWFDRRAARGATIALAFFPSAFFLSAVYSESLFLALSGGALWALYVRRDLLLAGAFGYLAAVTRNVGVLLVVPIAYEYIRCRRQIRREAVLGVVLPVAGLAAYCLYLWRVANQPLLFSEAAKRTWGRSLTNPLVSIQHGWDRVGNGWGYLFHPGRVFGTASANPPFLLADTLNVVFLVLVGALLVLGLRQLPRSATVYSVAVAAAPLVVGSPDVALTSYGRYSLAAIPLFAVLGRLLTRSNTAIAAWVLGSAVLGVYFTLEFVTSRWVA
ncbi:MAG: mannosyltransferase family protein [Gaiellaceae bacterium]|jgi:hypothetical protein